MANLAEIIKTNPNISLAYKYFQTTGLIDSFSTDDIFTLFIPTDGAFEKQINSLGLTKEEFINDTKKLHEILNYHISKGEKFFSKDLKVEKEVNTLSDQTLDLSVENDTFTVNGVNVCQRDIVADNGVLHLLDRVLIPIFS